MSSPLFYDPGLKKDSQLLQLGEEESYHAIKVLRMKKGDQIELTNGNGLLAKSRINEINKNKVDIVISEILTFPMPQPAINLAICPVKKREKTEWIVEKATEIGVNEIYFFTSRYSERAVLNYERLERILISAIKQSGNLFKPDLHQIKNFEAFIEASMEFAGQKLIAHCGTNDNNHFSNIYKRQTEAMIMIGPEGGFTDQEVNFAIKNGYNPVSLGVNKLRAETAAIFSLASIKSLNEIK
jgi:16S rRNA (uracil1498-N3)-methyltransferase